MDGAVATGAAATVASFAVDEAFWAVAGLAPLIAPSAHPLARTVTATASASVLIFMVFTFRWWAMTASRSGSDRSKDV
jgi:hypothetical protein